MITEGSVLNTRYNLDRKIGQGGFAQVFLATDQLLKRRVAVKVLNSDLTEDENFLGRFEREAQSIASLDHPNILSVYDYGLVENTAYLVMPYVEGGTLHDRLRRDRKLTPAQASPYLTQAAAALDYAHRRNIVHRDIKPQNMLIRAEDDRLLLADFGIAKVLSAASAHSRTGVMGTLSYMAPEQLDGNIGFGVDIYALGCVLFQMLTGDLPYTGTTEAVMMGHMMRPIPSVVERSRGQLPPVIQMVIERALAKRPEDRYRTAGEFAQAFQSVVAGAAAFAEQTQAARPVDAPTEAVHYTQQATQALTNQPVPPTVQPPRTGPQYDRTQVGMVIPPGSYTPPGGVGGYNTPPNVTGPQAQGYITGPQGYQTGPQGYTTSPQFTPPNAYNTGPQVPPVRKGPNMALIGGLVAIIVIAVAAIVILLLLNKGQDGPAVPTATVQAAVSPSQVATTQAVTSGPAQTTAPVQTTAAPVKTTAPATTVTTDPIASRLKAANDTYYVKGDFPGGVAAYRALSQDYPNNAKVWRDYGNALRYWNRNADSAGLEQLEKAVQLDPKDPLAFLYLADTYVDNYRYDDALKAAKNAVTADPNSWYSHAALMLSYKAIHDAPSAKTEAAAMQKAVGVASNDPYYNALLADFLSFQNDYKLGLDANNKARAVWPNIPSLIVNDAVLTLNSADARQRSEDVKKEAQQHALASLQQAEKLAPQSTPVLTTFSAYYSIFAKDTEQADKYAQSAIKSNPNDGEAHRVTGLVLVGKKDYDNAVKEYQKCNSIDKFNINCYLEASDAYIGQGLNFTSANKAPDADNAYKAALAQAQEAITHDPENFQGQFYAGIAYYDLKDYKNGIAAFQKAISLNPDNADNYAWEGLCYLKNNQRDEAQAAYNKGNTLDPNNDNIKYLGTQLNP